MSQKNTLVIDIEMCTVLNQTNEDELEAQILPNYVLDILQMGDIKPLTKQQLQNIQANK